MRKIRRRGHPSSRRVRATVARVRVALTRVRVALTRVRVVLERAVLARATVTRATVTRARVVLARVRAAVALVRPVLARSTVARARGTVVWAWVFTWVGAFASIGALAQSPGDPAEPAYTGERLSLNFQDISTRAVLQLLADTGGVNMVVSDAVQSSVTLQLRDVPWDQVLDIVLTTKGLDMRRNGNVIVVAPPGELAAREQAALDERLQRQQQEPLHTRYMQINYAKAADLANLILGGGQNPLTSDRGSVTVDERTNTLLVQDIAGRIADIEALVSRLDMPVRQVLIESRIVIVNDDYRRDLGVRLGATAVGAAADDGLVAVTGSGAGIDTLASVDSTFDGAAGQPIPLAGVIPPVEQRYNVNVPVANPAGRLALAILRSDYLLDLELSAIQAEGNGRIVSMPRIITANQKEARIEQGTEIPYQESSSSGATTTQFKEAVLSLAVTPQITPDDRIVMDLVVTKDSVGELVSSATGGFVPSVDTRSVMTQVLVGDGETVVLGGIIETESRETTRKVPVLGDVPALGRLFRSRVTIENEVELMVFVTPRILRE